MARSDPTEPGIRVEPLSPEAVAEAARAGDPARAFLRPAWFGAAAGEGVSARRGSGEALAAIPLAFAGKGPFRIRQVPGSYWPFRSLPLAAACSADDLAAILSAAEARRALGPAWRLGPVYADDPAVALLAAAAPRAGRAVLTRSLGTAFELDLAALTASGSWPGTSTLRKNRWHERRLAEQGELDFRHLTSAEVGPEVFDAIAAIEAESWVAAAAGGADAKFLNPAHRAHWQRAAADPELAAMLFASILTIGGAPAAFTFGIEAGATRWYVANGYADRFRKHSPGRMLLYRDFQRAAAAGVTRIGWGAGDPGYKAEMGARPGPEILDLLIVRRALAPLLRPFWRKGRSA